MLENTLFIDIDENSFTFNTMRASVILLLLGIWVSESFAQLSPLPACGTSVEEQLLLKERVAAHKRLADGLKQELRDFSQFRSDSDSIYYVPVQVHICGQDNGNGYIPISRVIGSLCKLNADYHNQNIQFYMYGVNYISNTLLYNHGSNSGNPTASYLMSLYKVDDVMNIFIGREVTASDQFLAYYTSGVDVIYTFKTGVGAGNPTLTHEVGHFFSLSHTFFGWEGTNYYNEVTNNHAPSMVGGHLVEKVVRGASGENCQLAGDGFCDTPPDYASSRSSCPQATIWFDPDSVLINPDETNFMSYFNDNCVSSFTMEQREAILLDFMSRGYYMQPHPSPLFAAAAPVVKWPKTDAVAHYYAGIPLSWHPADSASLYLITIYRSYNNGALLLFVTQEIMTSDTTHWVSLPPNLEFTWNVKAMTSYDLCNSLRSPNETFTTGDWELSVPVVEQNSYQSRIYPNPSNSSNGALTVEIHARKSTQMALSIYDGLGRQVFSEVNLLLNSGINLNQINLNRLKKGIYLICLQNEEEQIYHKLIISE